MTFMHSCTLCTCKKTEFKCLPQKPLFTSRLIVINWAETEYFTATIIKHWLEKQLNVLMLAFVNWNIRFSFTHSHTHMHTTVSFPFICVKDVVSNVSLYVAVTACVGSSLSELCLVSLQVFENTDQTDFTIFTILWKNLVRGTLISYRIVTKERRQCE